MLPIVKAPNEVLSQKAKLINKVDRDVLNLIEEMKETLANTHDPEGVGLAAPQVGKSVQLFIMKPTHDAPVSIFINPVVTLIETPDSKSLKTESLKGKKVAVKGEKRPRKLEGCLSLHTVWGVVERKNIAKVTYMDETGKTHTKTFKGFEAIIIQHEKDHLDGILFPKRTLEQGGKLYKQVKDKKGKDVFEELDI